jgi:AraC family transcriptional regulator of adaptative response / DNA-3-methyladenine glycosylase II
MQLERGVCERAWRSRDARFDGRFFMGVTTTGIYCRPVCPAPRPRNENVRYFPSAAAAAAAGFRPCLRCRPEASPGTPAWLGTSAPVSRALRLIDAGALDDGQGLEGFAERLGMTGRHVRRLFLRHLGATPGDIAGTRRLHFAKKLIDETGLSFAEVAFASGFGSIRAFNREIQATYARTPTELRALARPPRHAAGPNGNGPAAGHCYRFRLAYRPPYDWPALLAFLRARALPGVEDVDGVRYRRTIALDGQAGVLEVRHAPDAAALSLEVHYPNPLGLLRIVTRVRQLSDLSADPAVVAATLGRDPLLARPLRRHPGLRVPGAWDGFELAVRAVLGQQVSVAAARTLAGRLVSLFGGACGPEAPGRLFPTAAQLADADVERAGVVRTRARAIRELARRVERGALPLHPGADVEATLAGLREVPGVGEWTAQYVALRACGAPDAFPAGDLVLRRALGARGAREAETRAEAWRPWRGYAVMLLWQDAADRARQASDR